MYEYSAFTSPELDVNLLLNVVIIREDIDRLDLNWWLELHREYEGTEKVIRIITVFLRRVIQIAAEKR